MALLIRNGTVVDGTNTPSFVGDIAIVDGKITAISHGESLPAIAGAEELDAAGRIVAPCWIDVHTHLDAQVMWGERSPDPGRPYHLALAPRPSIDPAPRPARIDSSRGRLTDCLCAPQIHGWPPPLPTASAP